MTISQPYEVSSSGNIQKISCWYLQMIKRKRNKKLKKKTKIILYPQYIIQIDSVFTKHSGNLPVIIQAYYSKKQLRNSKQTNKHKLKQF